jgi:hypothetical protein
VRRTEWKDATGYNRGERGTVEPRAWEMDLEGLRVSVHRFHGCDGWFGSCHAMGVDRLSLTCEEIADARVQFVDYLHRRAMRWVEKLARARSAEQASGDGKP